MHKIRRSITDGLEGRSMVTDTGREGTTLKRKQGKGVNMGGKSDGK